MVLEKLWVSQNFSRISQVSRSRFLSVMCVSQSRLLYEGVSESRVFSRLRVSKSRFVCLFVFFLLTPSHHLILNFIKATFNCREKLSEFHKKLENLPKRRLAPGKKKKRYFVLGCNNIVL